MYMYVFVYCAVCNCEYLLQDLLDPTKRDEIAAARATLKKNNMMLLTTSKVRALH